MPTDPMNGMINCSLGDDGVLSFEDTCTLTCAMGYMVIGAAMRTCQSDGTFSGTEANCSRSKKIYVITQEYFFVLLLKPI